MTPDFIVGFSRQAIETTLMLALPMLGLGMIVGLTVSIFQSVTQIQEMTLTFVPKILAVMMGMLIFGPWMLSKLMFFTEEVFKNFPSYIK
ncbi:MAG: flagellar biosynthesis protein FliQ [Desulfarculaceae bacterium]|jgi:flagellar biosynthetic protein FliQ